MQIEAFAGIFLVVGAVFVLLSYSTVLARFFVCCTAGSYRPYNFFGTVFQDNIWRGGFVCCKWFSSCWKLLFSADI
jgi:hypothetical protein